MIKAEVKNNMVSIVAEYEGLNKKEESVTDVIQLCSAILEEFIKGRCKQGLERETLTYLLAVINMEIDLGEDK